MRTESTPIDAPHRRTTLQGSFIVLIAPILLSLGYGSMAAPQAVSENTPDVRIQTRLLDYGEQRGPDGGIPEPVSLSFDIENMGDVALDVTSLEIAAALPEGNPAEGCFIADRSASTSTPLTVAPGATPDVPGVETVTVTFAPTARGDYSSDLRLQCNDPDEPELVVSLRGICRLRPAPFAYLAPVDGEDNLPDQVILSWEQSSGAWYYDVYLGQAPALGASDLILRGWGAGRTTCTANLKYNSSYYWRVNAANNLGGVTGDVWSFSTARDLTAPVSSVADLPRASARAVFPISFSATDPPPAATGIGYVEIHARKDGGPWTTCAVVSAEDVQPVNVDFSDRGEGFYEFYSVAVDAVGNREPPPAEADTDTLVLKEFAGNRVYVSKMGSAVNSGETWSSAVPEIGLALETAEVFEVSEVWVARGLYHEAIEMVDGVRVYGGFAANEEHLSERDWKANPTVLSGRFARGGLPAWHVAVFDNVTSAAIDGFTITGGSTGSDVPRSDRNGAGVWLKGGADTNTIANCTITGNTAAGNGGGICCEDSHPRIVNSIVTANSAGWYGAGVFCTRVSPEITDCTIAANFGDGVEGEAVLSRCLIVGNEGAGVVGGAVLSRCLIVANSSALEGNATVTNCAIVGNTSVGLLRAMAHCAVVFNGGPTEPYESAANSIFAHNSDYAILHGTDASGDSAVEIHGCLFQQNRNGDYVEKPVSFFSGIEGHIFTGAAFIDMHLPAASGNVDGDPRFVFQGQDRIAGNLTEVGTFTTATWLTTLYDAGATFAPGALAGEILRINTPEPVYTVIADNTPTAIMAVGRLGESVTAGAGYEVLDLHLRDGSAALDRGLQAYAPETDLDGEPRPGGDGLVDIGLDEAPAAFTPPVDTAPPESRAGGLPAATTNTLLYVFWRAGDSGSGVDEVHLFFRKDEAVSWTPFGDPLETNPVVFDASEHGGEGRYEFRTVASDRAGNVEPPPPEADDACLVLSDFTGRRVYVDRAATGKGTGQGWPDACRDISEALSIAAIFGAPEVWVADGVYPEALDMPPGVALYGGFAGGEELLAERDRAIHRAVVDARAAWWGLPPPHAITLDSVADVRLDGLTITGGGNLASAGGGVCCIDTRSTCTITDCDITGNKAAWGGGVFNGVGEFLVSRLGVLLMIERCRITDNVAAETGGGACAGQWMDIMKLEDCAIIGNSAGLLGGGLYCGGDFPWIRMTNCIIAYNSGEAIYTGGYFGLSTLANCTIAGNTQGLSWDVCSSVQALNSILADNGALPEADDTLTGSLAEAVSRRGGGAGDEPRSSVPLPPVLSAIAYCVANPPACFTNCLFDDDNTRENRRNDYLRLEGDPLFVMDGHEAVTGTWTAPPVFTASALRTTLTDESAVFDPGALVGDTFHISAREPVCATVVANTETTIEVIGDMRGRVEVGDAWRRLDFRPRGGSPAIDAALSGDIPTTCCWPQAFVPRQCTSECSMLTFPEPSTDIDGNPRPVDIAGLGPDRTGSEYDIGALEVQELIFPESLVFSHQEYDFGNLAPYQMAESPELFLRNLGESPATIQGLSWQADPWMHSLGGVPPVPATLEAGEAFGPFTVTFLPTRYGEYAAFLDVAAVDGSDPAAPLALNRRLSLPIRGTCLCFENGFIPVAHAWASSSPNSKWTPNWTHVPEGRSVHEVPEGVHGSRGMLHDPSGTERFAWQSQQDYVAPTSVWIAWDFGESREVSDMLIWNALRTCCEGSMSGFRRVLIQCTTDPPPDVKPMSGYGPWGAGGDLWIPPDCVQAWNDLAWQDLTTVTLAHYPVASMDPVRFSTPDGWYPASNQLGGGPVDFGGRTARIVRLVAQSYPWADWYLLGQKEGSFESSNRFQFSLSEVRFYGPTPQVTWDVSAHDFGAVEVGESASFDVRVSNQAFASENLMVRDAFIEDVGASPRSGPPYTIGPAAGYAAPPMSLAPGESAVFTVVFAPEQAGDYGAFEAFVLNSSTRDSLITIRLAGSAYDERPTGVSGNWVLYE